MALLAPPKEDVDLLGDLGGGEEQVQENMVSQNQDPKNLFDGNDFMDQPQIMPQQQQPQIQQSLNLPYNQPNLPYNQPQQPQPQINPLVPGMNINQPGINAEPMKKVENKN